MDELVTLMLVAVEGAEYLVSCPSRAVKTGMLSFGVKPPLKVIETEVNRKSYGKAVLDDWYMRIDTTHIKTVDIFAVAEKADKLVQDRIYSPNGIREKLDDEPIPEAWADEYTMTKNLEVVD